MAQVFNDGGRGAKGIRSGKFRVPGDSRKIAQAIVNSADQETAPYRFTLGSEAYELVHNALSMRIAALSAQKKLAFSTDADDLDRNSAKVVWK